MSKSHCYLYLLLVSLLNKYTIPCRLWTGYSGVFRCELDRTHVCVLRTYLMLNTYTHYLYVSTCFNNSQLTGTSNRHKRSVWYLGFYILWFCQSSNCIEVLKTKISILGPFGEEALDIVKDLGRRMIETQESGELRSRAYFTQYCHPTGQCS
jgi:hypothetical protein